jgi:hypothetical protein
MMMTEATAIHNVVLKKQQLLKYIIYQLSHYNLQSSRYMGTLVFQSIISSKARDIPSKFAQ